jgi:hypothetical protein
MIWIAHYCSAGVDEQRMREIRYTSDESEAFGAYFPLSRTTLPQGCHQAPPQSLLSDYILDVLAMFLYIPRLEPAESSICIGICIGGVFASNSLLTAGGFECLLSEMCGGEIGVECTVDVTECEMNSKFTCSHCYCVLQAV